MKWEHHYTGSDFARPGWRWASLFMERTTSTKEICYVRADFGPLYGFGWRRGSLYRVDLARGHTLWINAYKWAPVKFSWLSQAGWVTYFYRKGKFFRLENKYGSQDEDVSYSCRVGRLWWGGNYPKFIARRLSAKEADRWAAMYEDADPQLAEWEADQVRAVEALEKEHGPVGDGEREERINDAWASRRYHD